jgi:hypothetical protein
VIPRPSEAEEGCTGFWWENLKQNTLEDLHVGVNERIMLKLTFKNRVEGVDKIHLAHNRDQS